MCYHKGLHFGEWNKDRERNDDLRRIQRYQADNKGEIGKLKPWPAGGMNRSGIENDDRKKDFDRLLASSRKQMQDTAVDDGTRCRREPDAGISYRYIKKKAGPGSSNQDNSGEL